MMLFHTVVELPERKPLIAPCDEFLCVGSCFANNIAEKFIFDGFRVICNPNGVMYNPASILHTIEKLHAISPQHVIITLGTNHVYRQKSDGKIVDNCEKRPHSCFQEEELTIEQCSNFILQAIELINKKFDQPNIFLTVSPIRYKKYGFHKSQLSKSVLLLSVENVINKYKDNVEYFPAYEIVNDELRDYRFYKSDMIHPSEQAVDYIYEKFSQCYYSDAMVNFLSKWIPLQKAFSHKPFNPETEEYKIFYENNMNKLYDLKKLYPNLNVNDNII